MTVSLYVRVSSGAKRRYVPVNKKRFIELALCFVCAMPKSLVRVDSASIATIVSRTRRCDWLEIVGH
jgi:hypothetical protein